MALGAMCWMSMSCATGNRSRSPTGPGIKPDDLGWAIGSIGNSSKVERKVNPDQRAYHGLEGEMLFKALSLSPATICKTRYREGDKTSHVRSRSFGTTPELVLLWASHAASSAPCGMSRCFVVNGVDADEYSGFPVASAGDVNGDGVDDIVIGANGADPNGNSSGQSYVVFGGLGVGAGGSIELSSLDGTNGFVLNRVDERDMSGRSVSSAGDVNGDGSSDLITGAPGSGPNFNSTGDTYVVFGREGVAPCSDDADGDVDTDLDDFSVLAVGFGSVVRPGTGADFDSSGVVDLVDFAILAINFGCDNN